MIENQEIYQSALALLSLSPTAEGNEDFAERAPFHLASFCTEAEELDQLYRAANDLEPGVSFHKVFLPLDSDFPLSDRLAPAAGYYLAALLILDEDPDRSDELYDKYADAMCAIRAELPASLHPIKNQY